MKKMCVMLLMLVAGATGSMMAQEVDSVAMKADMEKAAAAAVAKEKVVEESEEDPYRYKDPLAGEPYRVREAEYGASVAHKWEQRYGMTFTTTTGTSAITSDESMDFDFFLGYNLTKHFCLGLSTGYWMDFGGVSGGNGGNQIPGFLDLQWRWNVKKRWSLAIEGRGGYMLHITKDCNGEYGGTFRYPDYLYGEITPVLIYRPNLKVDLRFSAGYAYAKPINECEGYEGHTYDETVIAVKFAIGFHK